MQVKGGRITLSQLAEQWLLHSSKVFHKPFSGDAFATLLKEAEQFLWAGSEMDAVSFKPSSVSFSVFVFLNMLFMTVFCQSKVIFCLFFFSFNFLSIGQGNGEEID